MRLNRDSWFVKYWVRFGCTSYGYEGIVNENYGRGTDICTLARIVLLWAPLKALAILLPLGFIIFNIFADPMTALAVFALIICSCIGAAIFFGAIYLASKGFDKARKTDSVTFVKEYYSSWKGKYCSKVTFDGNGSNSSSSNTAESF